MGKVANNHKNLVSDGDPQDEIVTSIITQARKNKAVIGAESSRNPHSMEQHLELLDHKFLSVS
ncbi:conserved hypothetical protein [Ricinus communis]|uniref:Uncharacterized protein n=1 Tax=Ricinus communis TaxID=3988 RepID=B9RRD4_RICCO|nr:conserved hypothetical protein [Ricinus communis]